MNARRDATFLSEWQRRGLPAWPCLRLWSAMFPQSLITKFFADLDEKLARDAKVGS